LLAFVLPSLWLSMFSLGYIKICGRRLTVNVITVDYKKTLAHDVIFPFLPSRNGTYTTIKYGTGGISKQFFWQPAVSASSMMINRRFFPAARQIIHYYLAPRNTSVQFCKNCIKSGYVWDKTKRFKNTTCSLTYMYLRTLSAQLSSLVLLQVLQV
jgi:hypothetical protein